MDPKLIQAASAVVLMMFGGAITAHLLRPSLSATAGHNPGTQEFSGKALSLPMPRAFSFRLAQALAGFILCDFIFLSQPFAEPLLWGPLLIGTPLIWMLAIKDFSASQSEKDVAMAIIIPVVTGLCVFAKLGASFRLM